MTHRYEDRLAVAGKIEWEGGIMEALDYGVRAEHMPEGDKELIRAWSALEDAYRAVKKLADAVDDLLPESGSSISPVWRSR